jgi:hypothetical protein
MPRSTLHFARSTLHVRQLNNKRVFPLADDRKVAGVVAGASGCRPAIVLGRRSSGSTRYPIALSGRTFCRVDAAYDPIEVGDMLTTSPTPGHAMKASDPARAFGAVIGKALRPLRKERALIPILISLQ